MAGAAENAEEAREQKKARRRDLPDIVTFMIGTGVRIGEALGVRRRPRRRARGRARFRDFDGVTRWIERAGSTKAAASRFDSKAVNWGFVRRAGLEPAT